MNDLAARKPRRRPSRPEGALFCYAAAALAALAPAACGNKTEKPGKSSAKPQASAEAPAPTGSAVIKGVVKLNGAPPAPESWAGAGNADCKGLHPDTVQLVKAQDGKLEDVFVYVKGGLPAGSYPTPTEPVVFDQKGCEFSPRVFGTMAGQPLAIGNSDKLMHNVKSPDFNQAFPFGVKKTMELGTPAVMAVIKCDVHPWMRAYAGVMEHPYFAVTKADGAFEIKGLVDGEYTLEAWHEKLGTVEKKVTATAA
jgi:hypothetical protein